MEITAERVKELRQRTGIGVMGCKEALAECEGDIEKAIAVAHPVSGRQPALARPTGKIVRDPARLQRNSPRVVPWWKVAR